MLAFVGAAVLRWSRARDGANGGAARLGQRRGGAAQPRAAKRRARRSGTPEGPPKRLRLPRASPGLGPGPGDAQKCKSAVSSTPAATEDVDSTVAAIMPLMPNAKSSLHATKQAPPMVLRNMATASSSGTTPQPRAPAATMKRSVDAPAQPKRKRNAAASNSAGAQVTGPTVLPDRLATLPDSSDDESPTKTQKTVANKAAPKNAAKRCPQRSSRWQSGGAPRIARALAALMGYL